jgi:hypothetical protein
LLNEEGSFKTQLFDSTMHAGQSCTADIVGFFDLVQALLELDTFAAVSFFD